jgi:hypothetical protein
MPDMNRRVGPWSSSRSPVVIRGLCPANRGPAAPSGPCSLGLLTAPNVPFGGANGAPRPQGSRSTVWSSIVRVAAVFRAPSAGAPNRYEADQHEAPLMNVATMSTASPSRDWRPRWQRIVARGSTRPPVRRTADADLCASEPQAPRDPGASICADQIFHRDRFAQVVSRRVGPDSFCRWHHISCRIR